MAAVFWASNQRAGLIAEEEVSLGPHIVTRLEKDMAASV